MLVAWHIIVALTITLMSIQKCQFVHLFQQTLVSIGTIEKFETIRNNFVYSYLMNEYSMTL